MKTINVVAAIIQDGDRILATQRGYGDYKDGWEFPGGKIETGETPEEALMREIQEELDLKIEVGDNRIPVLIGFCYIFQCDRCHVSHSFR